MRANVGNSENRSNKIFYTTLPIKKSLSDSDWYESPSGILFCFVDDSEGVALNWNILPLRGIRTRTEETPSIPEGDQSNSKQKVFFSLTARQVNL